MKGFTSDEFQDCVEKLEVFEGEVESAASVLSLHALNGSQGHNTMRLAARTGQHEVIMLVDSGSTHNFMDSRFMKLAHLVVDFACRMRVVVVVGGQLATQGLCRRVSWDAQGH